MRARRITRLVAMGGVALLGLAGCSSSGDASSGTGREGGDKISLRVLTWTSNPDQLATFKSISNEFIKAHPNVEKINWETVAFKDIATVLTTQLSSSDPPDLSWLGIESSKEFVDAGVLIDLAPTLKQTTDYNFDDLIPDLQKHWALDQQLFGVPMSTSGRAMYYNKDLFKAAGEPTPDEMMKSDTWDWEHFASAAKAITEKKGTSAFATTIDGKMDWTVLVPLWYAYGAAPWDDASTKCTMDSPEMIKAMTLIHQMLYVDKSASLPGQAANFWGGQGGATSTYLSSAKLLDDAKFKWGIVPTPAGPAGDKQQIGQTSWVVYKAGKHAEISAELVAFLSSKDNQKELAQYFVPTRSSLLNAQTLHGSFPSLSEKQLQPLIDAAKKSGDVAPVAAKAAAANQALNSALNEFFYQPGADVRQAMTRVCEALNPALTSS